MSFGDSGYKEDAAPETSVGHIPLLHWAYVFGLCIYLKFALEKIVFGCLFLRVARWRGG